MEQTPPTSPNPLGLNIDFMFGRGYLWARQERLSDWIGLESLRMEIPDLQFPFDARGGLNRFRHTRCLVREIEVGISEAGLQDLMHRAASAIDGFEDLRLRFLEDAIHVSLKVRAFGAQTPLSFRVALIPPEPARVDEVHLSLYDYRAYGPLPYPARQLAFELMTAMLGTPTLRPPGRGRSFTVGIAGDILSFRPLKLILLHIFPRVGWKLPNLSGVVLDGAKIRPGQVSIRASGREDSWHTIQQDQFHLASSAEGARALAAYEAKDLFSHVDQAIFDDQAPRALELLESFREVYGAHPELVHRTLDCLLSNPTPNHLAEAAALVHELEREDAEDLNALMAAPTLAMLSRQRPAKIIEALERLSAALKRRQELEDWILCEQAIAQHMRAIDPAAAALRQREVLKLSPRNLQTLELLRDLYEELGDLDGVEEILKRLTGLYTERHKLKQTYLRLAHHLMDRRGQAAEARLYLERVLRLDPTAKEALYTLGQSYVLSQEPLRAIKAFGSAARAAQAEGDWLQAARLQLHIARHWSQDLDNASEGLLSARRALQHLDEARQAHATPAPTPTALAQARLDPRHDSRADALTWSGVQAPSGGASDEPLELTWLEALEVAARLSHARERTDEALGYWGQLLPQLEARHEHEQAQRAQQPPERWSREALLGLRQLTQPGPKPTLDPTSWRARLIQAHEQMAALYELRQRPEAAVAHWRRVLELDDRALRAAEQIERFYQHQGRPEELILFYRDRLGAELEEDQRVSVEIKLAQLYGQLQMVEEAQLHLQEALRLRPTHDRARALLVELLRTHERYETLRQALQTMLIRVQDRTLRHELLLQLGQLLLGELKQPRQSARAFFEALDLRPADESALRGAHRALEEIILREGVMAPSPIGADPVGRLQERVALKLVELVPDVQQQLRLLEEVATLATHRQDASAAQEATRRARALRERPAAPAPLEPRLVALLAPQAASFVAQAPSKGSSAKDHVWSEDRAADQEPEAQDDRVPAPTAIPERERRRFDAQYLRAAPVEEPAAPSPAPMPALDRPALDRPAFDQQASDRPALQDFRAKLQSVLTKPSRLSASTKDEGSALHKLLPRQASPKPKLTFHLEDSDPEALEEAVELHVRRHRAASSSEPTPTQTSRLAPDESPHEGGEELTWVEDADETPSQVRAVPADPALLSEALDDAWDAMATMARVDAARHAQDPEELAAALEDVLSATPSPEEHPHLTRAQYLGLCRELGELLYYELEDSQRASLYLERVRAADPEGLGAEPSLLNALESIYEEEGDLDRRLKLLHERMERAQGKDMAMTYRLLIAQLLWDERADYAGATAQLEVILRQDPRQEAAHRFWAQMAREREDWPTAAHHYEIVLQERVGGLDEVELERELADLYLHRLRQPLRARQRYEGVLLASPADAQAIEGIKQSQAMLGDWSGYLASLGRELALLLGQQQPIKLDGPKPQLPVERVPSALRTSASQIISDAAQIAQDEVKDAALAHALWSLAFDLWPEHVEALERRLAMARVLDDAQALCEALEAWAELLFEPAERFEALYEAARLMLERLRDEERARILLAEAIAVGADAQGDGAPIPGLDEARRLLHSLSA